MTTSAPWVQCAQPHSTAVCRLICFPHAGGSANAFRPWPTLLGHQPDRRPTRAGRGRGGPRSAGPVRSPPMT